MAKYFIGMVVALLVWSGASAYNVTPGGGDATKLCDGFGTTETGNKKIIESINAEQNGCPSLAYPIAHNDYQYKQDAGGGEDGPAAPYYSTTFNSDLSGGTISNSGGMYIDCPVCYLLVKDGNNSPIWYFFELNGWNGTDDLLLSGFWPANGAISNVQIWGGTMEVPAPATLALMGLGLLAMGIARRRRIG